MDAFEALGHDGFHAEKTGALGSPVAAGTGPVLLSGEDDEWNSILFVGHARIIDEGRFSAPAGRDFLVGSEHVALPK